MQFFQNFLFLLLFGLSLQKCPKPNSIRIRENSGKKVFNQDSPWIEVPKSDVDDLEISDDPENNGHGISDK